MSTTLSVTPLRQQIGWTLTDVQTFANSTNTGDFTVSTSLTNGTGAGAANKIYVVQDDTGISSSSSTTLDLQSLTSMFDDALSFSKVRAFFIQNTATTTGTDMLVGAAASTQWAGATALISTTDATLLVPAGASIFAINTNAAGWAVTASAKSLKLANASTTTALTYKLVVVGE